MKKYLIATLLASFFLIPAHFSEAEEYSQEDLKPVYAYWKKAYSYRYLSISEEEQNGLNAGTDWINEGVFWYAYDIQKEGTIPVFKFKNNFSNNYYFTILESQKNSLTGSEWTYRGIVFYAYENGGTDKTPVYALKNSITRKYFYTSSEEEKNCLMNNSSNWTDRGIAFWVLKENAKIYGNEICKTNLGPEISVGLWQTSSSDAKENAFTIRGDRKYLIKDSLGNVLAKISAGTATKVKYFGDGKLLIYGPLNETKVNKKVSFEAADGKNDLIVFDANRPNSTYDHYRGKIEIRYTDKDNVWVINTLPIEHYTWGMGETTGTGPFEHTKVMTTMFRTYGYWYKKYATKYLKYGFNIRSDSGSQIYQGYDWEMRYPNIKKAAAETNGTIAKYNDEIALTPYSSWSDGKTRSFEDRWGSDDYPWCQSVKDPYGKNSSLNTQQLESSGNHMVGLIANGSVKLAGSSYNKTYDWILKYYYTGVSLKKAY